MQKASNNWKSISFFLIFIQIQLQINCQNIICNGNFTGYALYANYDSEYYLFTSSNYSCWYNKVGGQIEIKNKIYPPMGNSIELVTNVAYVLCQKVQLQANQAYSLGFRLGNCKSMTYSTITVTMNNVFLMNLTANGQLKIVYGSTNFTWNLNQTATLCFSPKYYIGNAIYQVNGPTLNNITLTKIQIPIENQTIYPSNSTVLTNNTNSSQAITNFTSYNQTGNYSNNYNATPVEIIINCKTSKTDIYNQILMNCNYTSQFFYNSIKTNQKLLQVYLEGELLTQYDIKNILPTSSQIVFYPKRSYRIDKISIFLQTQKQDYFNSLVHFKFIIDNIPVTFSYLSQKQALMIKNVYPLAENLLSYAFKVYMSLKSCFVSYFLTDLISFWNLSLMYNLLNISTVPLFLKYFFQNLSYQFFNLNSIIEWIGNRIPNFQEKLNFSSTLGEQKMADFQNDFAWFGSFGMSSGFLSNNTENIMITGILIIKLISMNFVRKLLCFCSNKKMKEKMQKFIPHGVQLRLIFIEELFLTSIFMVVSAMTTLLDLGFEIWKEKINFYLQFSFLWILLMLYPLFMIMKLQSMTKKVGKIFRQKYLKFKQNLEQKNEKCVSLQLKMKKLQNKLRKKLLLQSAHYMFEYLLYLFIPAFIVFGSVGAFLSIMSCVIAIRIFWYMQKGAKFRRKNSLKERIFTILNLFIWLIHHCLFNILYPRKSTLMQ